MNHEQRPAEAFAAAIDRLLARGRLETAEDTDPSLLDLAYRLWRAAPRTLIDPRFRVSLRQRLMLSPPTAEERYAVLETAIGRLHIAHRGRVVCGLGVATDDRAFERL